MLQSWADSLLIVKKPRPTQPSIPPGLVNEDHLRLGRLRQVWFIPFVDKHEGVQVKLEIPRQCVPYLGASEQKSAVMLLH